MPRKTDSSNPADWLFIAESELEALRHLTQQQIAYTMCQSKLAEVLEQVTALLERVRENLATTS